jgi:hypothetical protein
MPKMPSASPIWLTDSPSILHPLEIGYNRICRWITGLPPSTRIIKLLRCAHLPPLNVWLDLISTQYAIRLITLLNDHGLYPIPKYQHTLSSKPGFHRIISFVSEYLSPYQNRKQILLQSN